MVTTAPRGTMGVYANTRILCLTVTNALHVTGVNDEGEVTTVVNTPVISVVPEVLKLVVRAVSPYDGGSRSGERLLGFDGEDI